MSYGSILTSVMSLSSTAVDILLLRSAGDGSVQINVGAKANIKEESALSIIVGILLAAVLVVCPKIIMYSWTIAMFSWRALAFFILMAFIIFFLKMHRKWKSENIKMNLSQFKKSLISTATAIFSVEKSPTSSIATLSFCSIFAIIVLSCTLPNNNNETSLTFNETSSSNFYQRDPENNSTFCICKTIDIEQNRWQNQYFNHGIVCQKLSSSNTSEKNTRTYMNTTSKCYDKIFFKIPFAYSLIPLEGFPAITSCVTYDGIQNYLTKLERNLSLHLHFDETCDADVKDMYVPCSDEMLVTTIGVLSVMIVWMGCGLLFIVLSPKIAKFLFSINWVYAFKRLFFKDSWQHFLILLTFCRRGRRGKKHE